MNRKKMIACLVLLFMGICTGCTGGVQEAKEQETENKESILKDDNVIDLGNHIVAYRTSSDMMRTSYKGEYIAIYDLISSEILYLPDIYEEVYEMAMEGNESIFISYNGTEENNIQEVHIPVQFPKQTDTVYAIKPMNEKILTELKGDITTCLEELPRLIWEENAVCEDRNYKIMFERTSPVYLDPYSESWGRYADYCLTVKDEEDNIVSEQIMANYAIDYEEVYWLTDFSGDGFPDIAFCTYSGHSKENYEHLEFMIWNAEAETYEPKPLPVYSMTRPVWNDAKSSIILVYNGKEDVALGMYSFLDGDWELVGELISIFDETDVDEDGDLLCVGWKEIFYENGEVVEENRIIREEITYAPWSDDESIWGRDNKENEKLYPDISWDWIETMVGEDIIYKYVREQ